MHDNVTLLVCRRLIDCCNRLVSCHCERSEAISNFGGLKIAAAAFCGLAMTTPKIMSDRALLGYRDINEP